MLILDWSDKFVPFSPFSKREIIVCLSFIERTDCFRGVDIAVICVYDRYLSCGAEVAPDYRKIECATRIGALDVPRRSAHILNK